MALRLEDKKALVTEVNAVAQTAHVGGRRGVSRADGLEDDRAAREGARSRRLHARREEHAGPTAVAGTQYECIGAKLKGPLILAFSQEDPGAAARLIKEFAKDNDKLVPTLVSLGGQRAAAKDLERVASLPTRAGSRYVARRAEGPDRKFVRTLAEPHAKLVRTIAAVKDQKAQPPERPMRVSRVFRHTVFLEIRTWLLARKRFSTQSPT